MRERTSDKEYDDMQNLKYYAGALVLVGALALPMAGKATAQDDHERDHKDRVYDREHKDYHHWDENENRAWIRYNQENHHEAHEWAKANRKEQAEYWRWRHEHPDEH
jgi:hypothetical protein